LIFCAVTIYENGVFHFTWQALFSKFHTLIIACLCCGNSFSSHIRLCQGALRLQRSNVGASAPRPLGESKKKPAALKIACLLVVPTVVLQ
jgi:hypothetical protein